ncbi:hypothetical protein [Egicoccus sp. AB-alg6-2]|uniref:hypothetical protein n=1 Tax=Egicoccus sp. AB-alg6-2 TaxID=3242692 RepID=UPI00359CCF7A
MDAAERIADYLSGDLPPDERAAFEADLDRDAALRAQLASARRADVALDGIAATTLPEGFTDRLRTAVDAELQDLFTPATVEVAADPRVAAAAELGRNDDLAARRAARQAPRWTGLAGAAAAAVVAVAAVVGVSTLGGAGDQGADMASPAEDTAGGAETFESAEDGEAGTMMAPESDADDAGDEATEEQASDAALGDAPAADGAVADGPTIFADDRDLDEADLDEILLAVELQEVGARRLDETTGAALARDWTQVIRDSPFAAATGDERFRVAGEVTADDRTAAASCTEAHLDGRADAIPAYVELASVSGRSAVVLGLVTLDEATGTYTRPQVVALDRDTCEVLATRP